MEIHKVLLPPDETNYLFFAFTEKHNDICYKGAVAEETLYDGEVTGGYIVLLQSEDNTQSFHINRNEEGLWEHEEVIIPHELVFKIGAVIDKYYK